MAGLQDIMARAAAAGAGAGGGMAPEEGMPPAEGDMGAPMDIETALGNVEMALQGLPEDQTNEIRIHLNAIRDIVGGGQGGEVPMESPEGAPEMPESSEKVVPE